MARRKGEKTSWVRQCLGVFKIKDKPPANKPENETKKPTEITQLKTKPEPALPTTNELLKKLEEKEKQKRNETENDNEEESDEDDNFTSIYIEDKASTDTGESGYGDSEIGDNDVFTDNDKSNDLSDITDDLKKLNVSDDEVADIADDLKKLQVRDRSLKTVRVARGPDRIRDQGRYTQVNSNTLTGGRVTVNAPKIEYNIPDFSEINLAQFLPAEQIDKVLQAMDSQPNFLTSDLDQLVPPSIHEMDLLSPVTISNSPPDALQNMLSPISNWTTSSSSLSNEESFQIDPLTPPSSNEASNHHQIYQPTYDEHYDDLFHHHHDNYDDVIIQNHSMPVSPNLNSRKSSTDAKAYTKKMFKDMASEIYARYTSDCCNIKNKSYKDVIREYAGRLQEEQKRELCVQVATMDPNRVYRCLLSLLHQMSAEKEALNYVLFDMLNRRLLAHDRRFFISDKGLDLLTLAVLKCPSWPLLTRSIVHHLRQSIQEDADIKKKSYIFNVYDEAGDNLLIACVRNGDEYADVLLELVRRCSENDVPLFNVQHYNTNGQSALHVACALHSDLSPRIRCVHVLMKHAGADMLLGDKKGGDSALHVAVNSAHCSLTLVLMMFKHHDLPKWHNLANAKNLSHTTPLQLAKSATRSRPHDYPTEVCEFLLKCRRTTPK